MEEIHYKEGKPLQGETMANINSKKRLKNFVYDEVNKMWEGILDFAHVAVGDEDRYKAFRGKVLRLGNNCARVIKKELDRAYVVDFVALNEDVIEVKPATRPAKKEVEVMIKRSRKNNKEEER